MTDSECVEKVFDILIENYKLSAGSLTFKWLREMAIKGCGIGSPPEEVAASIIKEIRARSIQEKLKQAGVLMNNEIRKKIREDIQNNVDDDEIIAEIISPLKAVKKPK